MTTLKDIEKEIVEEWRSKHESVYGSLYVDFLRAALNRVAEETKKAMMPEEKRTFTPTGIGRSVVHSDGWNTARAEMEQNFKKFTEGV